MRGEVRPPLQVAEPLHRGEKLRGVRRERRVGRARVSSHRARVVGRAVTVQRGSAVRRALPAADIRQPHGAGEPAVQRQPSASGQVRVRAGRFDPVLAGSDCAGAAAAPVRVPRVHIRVGHHHVRVHQKLQTVPGVRFQKQRRRWRRILVVVQRPVRGIQEQRKQ